MQQTPEGVEYMIKEASKLSMMPSEDDEEETPTPEPEEPQIRYNSYEALMGTLGKGMGSH